MGVARTERLLNLLTLLLNTRRPLPLREIRDLDEFGAYRTTDLKSGERAFERDKAALVELGVPVNWVSPGQESGHEGEGLGGYLIDRARYFLPELDLEPGEVALLSIAGAAAVALEHFPQREAIIRALAKLGFDVDESMPSPTLAHSPLQAGVDAERTGRNLDVLHDAVARRVRVELVYRGASGARSERAVDPYGLFYRQGIWYLVGYCHLRDGERTFHLGRMESVQPAGPRARRDEPDFEVPADFDLSGIAKLRPWEFPTQPPVEVTIRLAERLVPAIPEIFGGRARVEERDGETLVRITVTSQPALIAAVLPFGAAAEVLAPADLRASLADTYGQLAARYGSAREPGESR